MELNIGEVEIDLAGETHVLKPSLEACMAVSKFFGGFRNAASQVSAFDLEALTFVIAAGLGIEGKAAKALPGKVYKSGVQALAPQAIEFIGILSNGGKPMKADSAEDDSGK